MKEKNEKSLIERINGVDIYAVKDDNGKEIVPLKPICSALGVSYSSQVQKVQSHPNILFSCVAEQHNWCRRKAI